MSRKKFFYLSAAVFLLIGVIGSGLISIFLGIEHIRTLFLVVLIWSLFGVPSMLFLILALFAHSAEPFVDKSKTSFSSSFIAALGLIGIIALLIHFSTLFFAKNDPEGACNKLIEESSRLWKLEDDGQDDITCIVVFFSH